MARIGLSLHRKFRRLAADLEEFGGGFGVVLARGALELLWEPSYETGDAYLGDASDIGRRCSWPGDPALLVDALLNAGGPGAAGFIDHDERGGFSIHDLMDHAPKYVSHRFELELERKQEKRCAVCGDSFKSPKKWAAYCSGACRVRAHRRGETHVTHASAEATKPANSVTNELSAVSDDSVTHVTHGNATHAPAPSLGESVTPMNQQKLFPASEDPTPANDRGELRSRAGSPGVTKKPSKTETKRIALELFEVLNVARSKVIDGARALQPTATNLKHITARLLEGNTADDVRHVIAVRAAEVKRDASCGKWFNAVTPFRADNFARSLGMKPDGSDSPRSKKNGRGVAPVGDWSGPNDGSM